MLPVTQSDENIYAVSKFGFGKEGLKDFMNELRKFHEQLSSGW